MYQEVLGFDFLVSATALFTHSWGGTPSILLVERNSFSYSKGWWLLAVESCNSVPFTSDSSRLKSNFLSVDNSEIFYRCF